MGASGYAGQETLDRVLHHQALELYALGSDSLAGRAPCDLDPRLGRNGWRAVVEMIDDELLDGVRARSAELMTALERLSGVVSVRGRGLLIGIEVRTPAADVVAAAAEHGLLILTAGEHIVRLAPPLTVSADDADEAIGVLARILC